MYGLNVPGSPRKPAPRGSWVKFGIVHGILGLTGLSVSVWTLYDEAICVAYIFYVLATSIHFSKAFYNACAARESKRMRWGILFAVMKYDTGFFAGLKAFIIGMSTLVVVWLSGMTVQWVIAGSIIGTALQIQVLPNRYNNLKIVCACWCMVVLAYASGISVQTVVTNNLPLIAGCVVIGIVQVRSRVLQGFGAVVVQDTASPELETVREKSGLPGQNQDWSPSRRRAGSSGSDTPDLRDDGGRGDLKDPTHDKKA
jgi:hypothetical protein